jgi:hypothetical protein
VKGFLQGMHIVVRTARESLNRPDGIPLCLHGKHKTGSNWRSVKLHCAGATETMLATDVSPG